MVLVRDLLRVFLILGSVPDSFSSSSSYLALWILCLVVSHVYRTFARRAMPGSGHLPAVPDHAHPLRLGNPVEPGRLLQILLAPEALGVAVARL